ncbi:M23 family metallopeptidase [uncultured Bacteroides sp.]|uniref:M23 family metallopeptidase n=1 Tax=uncultured Bacteroides sp. TaxID=162156 RepID=UPI0026346683|nr:M23 family metallopeptidase [uncultured Bacteroides sp.]
MIKKVFLMLAMGAVFNGQAQTAEKPVFRSPFDFPLMLSANFGELRPNHFHNGLDIKTQGVVGKPIHCVADGYVSRVMVLHGGYGQAIFVTHPNGYTSVYGHVLSFAPKVQEYVRDYQYKNQTFVCDLKIGPDVFPVKSGEIIAISGNEGASAGPHLHLELRRNDNGDYVDAMPFFKKYLKDTKPPVASLVGFYPIKGKGVINGSDEKLLVGVGALNRTYTAWGDIYTGISAKDYMDGTSNFYGVHSVTLYVDSVEVFNSTTDEVSINENRMINGFTDYDELMRTRRLIMRSYKSPGNSLRLLHTGENRGVVHIDEERDYRFRYVLEDNFGNRKSYSFTVTGKKQPIPAYVPKADHILYWNRTNVIQEPGMELVIPKGMLYDNAELNSRVIGDSAGISFDYVLDAGHTPIHRTCQLSIGLRHQPIADSTKYYIEQRSGKWRGSAGGKLENGWIKANVRGFGTFSVAIDTVAPKVTPLDEKRWRVNRNIRFRVKDAETGIRSYKVFIDNQFVLFGLKKGILVIQDPEKVEKGVPHTVEVEVTDNCGNVTREQYKF